MIFKLYALGLKGYAREGFNLFDGILVVISVFDIALSKLFQISTGASVISAFRTLRILRVFKLAKKVRSL